MEGNGDLPDYPRKRIVRQLGITLLSKYMTQRALEIKTPYPGVKRRSHSSTIKPALLSPGK